ncbi:hypothetical protein LINGRAPRIM_LOCUS225, partial [Linum grandiflorum]
TLLHHHLSSIKSPLQFLSLPLLLKPFPSPSLSSSGTQPPGEVLRAPPQSMTKSNSIPPPPPPPPPPTESYHPPIYLPPPPSFKLPSAPLYKQHSWSPDIYRDEAWLRRKKNSKNRRTKSVTDEDVDELKACIELGFGFDSPEVDQRLSDTLPALGLYHAVNKNYNESVSKSFTDTPSSYTASDCDSPSSVGSPHVIFGPSENPQTVKTRLRQWAQVVACSVRQFSGSSS